MMFYEVTVFGMSFEGVESEGGWQLAMRTSNLAEATKCRDWWIDEIGLDNVDWNF